MKVRLPSLPVITSRVAGFTMIELLIVITILGILAVAVLSAINPLEQINRGRDTAAQGDAEQLLSAIERYNAFQERFPWEVPGTPKGVGNGAGMGIFVGADDEWDGIPSGSDVVVSGCSVLEILSTGDPLDSNCAGTDELKSAYANKIMSYRGDRQMAVYKRSESSADNVYVCFLPQSSAFSQAAAERCGTVLPDDFPTAMACPEIGGVLDTDNVMSCLP